jgi:hypothetical protein
MAQGLHSLTLASISAATLPSKISSKAERATKRQLGGPAQRGKRILGAVGTAQTKPACSWNPSWFSWVPLLLTPISGSPWLPDLSQVCGLSVPMPGLAITASHEAGWCGLSLGMGARARESPSTPHHLAVCLWVRFLTSLSYFSLICHPRLIALPAGGGSQRQGRQPLPHEGRGLEEVLEEGHQPCHSLLMALCHAQTEDLGCRWLQLAYMLP